MNILELQLQKKTTKKIKTWSSEQPTNNNNQNKPVENEKMRTTIRTKPELSRTLGTKVG
ncbi:MAG: hypothetical protein GY861_12085 [bacterium]|nr:hypothetical protein [bacterium]